MKNEEFMCKLSRRSALALPLAKRQCSRCCVLAAPLDAVVGLLAGGRRGRTSLLSLPYALLFRTKQRSAAERCFVKFEKFVFKKKSVFEKNEKSASGEHLPSPFTRVL